MRSSVGNWPKVRLGEHVDLITGFPFKSALYTAEKSEIRLLRGDNVAQGYIRWDGVKHWRIKDGEDYSRYLLEVGDVILAMDRPWIEAGLKYAYIKQSDTPCLLVQRVARIRGKNGLLTGYLRYIIGSQTFSDYIKPITTGVNIPHISAEQIKSFTIIIPPLPTQHRIADILSAYDDLIENNTRRIHILEQMAQSVYREWFGKVDAASLPEGWGTKTISDLCEFISRGVTPKYIDGSKRFVINQKANRGSTIDGSNLKELDPELFVPEEKFAREGDVLINSLGEGTLGRVHYFMGPDKVWAVDQHMTICRSTIPGTTLFIYFYLGSDEGQSRIEGLKTGGTNMTMLNISEVRQFKLIIPSKELLRKFYEFIIPFWQMKRILEQKNANLRRTRDLLLPKLVSGEISVDRMEIKGE